MVRLLAAPLFLSYQLLITKLFKVLIGIESCITPLKSILKRFEKTYIKSLGFGAEKLTLLIRLTKTSFATQNKRMFTKLVLLRKTFRGSYYECTSKTKN